MTAVRGLTRRSGDRGAAAVEFAIVAIILLILVMAIIDFGRLLFVQQTMKSASREAARTAAVSTGIWSASCATSTCTPVSASTDSSSTNSAVRAAWNSGGTAASFAAGGGTLTVSTTNSVTGTSPNYKACAAAGGSIPVTVSTQFKWLTPIGALLNIASRGGGTGGLSGTRTVSGSTTMRCE